MDWIRYKKYKDTAAKTKKPIALKIPLAIIFEVTISIFFEDKDKKNSLTSSELNFYNLKTLNYGSNLKPALTPPTANKADILVFCPSVNIYIKSSSV